MPKSKQPDTIRAAVYARAKQLDLGPYDLARLTGTGKDVWYRYFDERQIRAGTGDITTAKLDAVLRVLRMSPPIAQD